MKIILVQSFERNRRWSYSELVLLWPSGQEFILCNLYYISNKKKKVSSHQKKSITWIIKYKYVLFKSKLWESPFRYRFFQCFLLEFSLVFHYPHFWSILHLINASWTRASIDLDVKIGNHTILKGYVVLVSSINMQRDWKVGDVKHEI